MCRRGKAALVVSMAPESIQVKLLVRRWQKPWKLPLQWPCSPPGLDLYFLLPSPVLPPWTSYLPKQEHHDPNFNNYPVTPKPMPKSTSPYQTNSPSQVLSRFIAESKKKRKEEEKKQFAVVQRHYRACGIPCSELAQAQVAGSALFSRGRHIKFPLYY